MTTVMVRDGKIDDISQIAQIHVQTWQDAYKDILPQNFLNGLSVEKRANQWKESIKNNQSTGQNGLFVVSDGNKIYGFAACGAARNNEFAGYGELFAIYVAPEFQKHGYGYKLFEKVRGFLKAKGFNNAYVWSLEENIPAHNAYEKWGATRVAGQTKPVDLEDKQFLEIAHSWVWTNDLPSKV
jgi:GNAT superfamily N-acetyltransferase